jgi:PAS domain S-box-containing protein
MAEGLFHARMLFEDGQPHDWLYLEANQAFQNFTGLRDVVGRQASEVVPGFLKTNPVWLEALGRVAATGQRARFEAYSPSMNKWFSASAYSPKPEHFIALFENITERHQAQAALRESETKLKEAQRLANLGYWERDLIADRITWPAETCRLFGLQPPTHTLCQAELEAMIHPDDRKLQQQALAEALRGSKLYDVEYRIVRPSGEVRFVHVRDEIGYDESGRPTRLFGTVQDITERKNLEAEVALREQQLNAFFSDAPAGLVLLDQRLRYVRLNDRMAEVNGVPVKDHLGKTIREVLPRFAPVVEPLLEQVLATGKPILNIELSGEKPGRPGVLQHLMESFFPILGKEGKTDGVGVVLVDITEHKHAEELLRAREGEIRAIVENSPDFIIRFGRELRPTYVNPAFIKANGIPKEALLGNKIGSAVNNGAEQATVEEIEIFEQSLKCVFDTGRPLDFESTWPLPTGRGDFAVHLEPEFNARGVLTSVLSISRDITERKRMENSLRHSHAQLRALSARLQSAREEEAARMAREIHDDLGQQLTGLKMDLARAERKLERMETSPAVNSLLDAIVNATELADKITASIQEIAANLRPEMLDKLGLSAALHYESRRFQERTGVVCEARLPETEPELAPEVATALFRIFQECLTNVARHAHATKVEAALEPEDGWVSLRVRDNGRGIADAELASPASLGLLGMKERTAFLGGEIVFRRDPEGGTMVTVRVPCKGALVLAKATL